MKKVIYLAHYDIPDSKVPRYRSAPACAKIDYISKTIAELGYNIELLSASNTIAEKCPAEEKVISQNFKVSFLKGFKRKKNKLSRICSTVLFNINLLFSCLKKVKKNDTLIVYHSLALMWIVRTVKFLKSPKLILEVEEIYANVLNDPKTKRREIKYFDIADSYLFCSDLLDSIVNTQNKPSAVIYGTYQVEEDRNAKRNDGKIHLLYAGTFSKHKGGAWIAMDVAPYLSEKYHIHILGNVNSYALSNVQKRLNAISDSSSATITYDGFLSGEEYIRFVQSCDIGLSTQNPDAAFNDTSFPSKVLSYMSNGLRVVSANIKVLEESKLDTYINYYKSNSPSAIADTINYIDFSLPYDSRAVVKELDVEFRQCMIYLLN